MSVCAYSRYKQRVESWNPSYYEFLGAELHFFNLYLQVVGEFVGEFVGGFVGEFVSFWSSV